MNSRTNPPAKHAPSVAEASGMIMFIAQWRRLVPRTGRATQAFTRVPTNIMISKATSTA